MTEDELQALADNATFLYGRLAGRWVADDTPANRQTAQTRLERWCHLAGGGDWERFARRQAWDGLDGESALLLLCDGHLAERNGLPEWTTLLAEAFAQLSGKADAREPAAFVQPFVAAAQARLNRAVGDRLGWLSPPAQAGLARFLADQLATLARPTLEHESQPLDSISRRGLARLLAEIDARTNRSGSDSGNGPDDSSLTKIQWSIPGICQAYPVLARQLCTAGLHWVENIQEFLSRLEADWPVLADLTRLYPSRFPSVRALSTGLSDPHTGGRTVWRVDLAGTSVAYKPKEIGLDRAWNDLLVWCNERGLTPSLRPLWTLPRDGYGWMEWAERDDSTQPLFYRLAGVLLGLLHLLHASDAHGENLIFAGAHPLLIDAEMLCYPQVAGQEADDPPDVLRTGLLPRWIVGREDITEIGGLPEEAASEHWEEVVAGYEMLCRFVETHWDALDAADGPLAAFRRGRVRFAPRPTAAYTRLLEHLRHPAFLGRGVDFSIEADRLAYSYSRAEEQAAFRHLLPDEHAAIAQGDVPLFSAAVDGQEGWENGLRWPPFTPPDPSEQARQSHLIRASLERSPYLPAPTAREPHFLPNAIAFGELLAERAVPLGAGKIGWIGVQFQPKSGLHQHRLLGDDLYGGRAGIGLFLAGLYRMTGGEKWRAMAGAALRQSATTGDSGSRRYALALCSHLLSGSDSGNQSDLKGYSGDLVADSRNRQSVWGVLDGQAGLLLGLLALHQQTAKTALLEDAVACGERLLAGSNEWQNPITALGGFSHGAAGIAYALARLYTASGDARFLDGAARGWDFQRSLYDEQAGNWQDRRGATPVYLDNWCNGAAGIGLAAAGSLDVLPELADVVERAGALLTSAQPPFLDTLCCGGFGQIDCLLEMGLRLGRPEWVAQATAQARAALRRASDAGSFALYDDLPAHLFNPAFFRGMAGIGYTLLRLAAANRETQAQLPCALNWSAQDQWALIE